MMLPPTLYHRVWSQTAHPSVHQGHRAHLEDVDGDHVLQRDPLLRCGGRGVENRACALSHDREHSKLDPIRGHRQRRLVRVDVRPAHTDVSSPHPARTHTPLQSCIPDVRPRSGLDTGFPLCVGASCTNEHSGIGDVGKALSRGSIAEAVDASCGHVDGATQSAGNELPGTVPHAHRHLDQDFLRVAVRRRRQLVDPERDVKGRKLPLHRRSRGSPSAHVCVGVGGAALPEQRRERRKLRAGEHPLRRRGSTGGVRAGRVFSARVEHVPPRRRVRKLLSIPDHDIVDRHRRAAGRLPVVLVDVPRQLHKLGCRRRGCAISLHRDQPECDVSHGGVRPAGLESDCEAASPLQMEEGL
eukprot:1946640-Rhodomonas_salina.6